MGSDVRPVWVLSRKKNLSVYLGKTRGVVCTSTQRVFFYGLQGDVHLTVFFGDGNDEVHTGVSTWLLTRAGKDL